MIECTKFKYIGKGSLLGYADLFVSQFGMDIYGCTIFQKDGRKWLSFPAKEVQENGAKKYFPHMRFRKRESMDNFCTQAMAVIQPEIDKALAAPTREDDIDGFFG